MRSRIMPIAAVSAAALIAAAAMAPIASASSSVNSDHSRSAATASPTLVANSARAAALPAKAGKCQTKLGTTVPPGGDGILSVKGALDLDVAGAADFTCGAKADERLISKVTVMGYFEQPRATDFNVTVYADKGGEPDNNGTPVCRTQTVTFLPLRPTDPSPVKTVLKLKKPCQAVKGTNWLEVQAVSDLTWYWETQQELGGGYPADWRDTTGALGTACTPGYQDGVYMQDCIFGGDHGENDFMFTLS